MKKKLKEKSVEEVVKAISNMPENEVSHFAIWLDGWESCKNAMKNGLLPTQEKANV